jgi:GTP-binding protein HflX
VILSDTVGFITDLPTMLVAAFRATLEEVLSADLILHVRDISHLDTEVQRRDVDAVLDELGIDEADRNLRLVEVWNKIDRLAPDDLAALQAEAGRQPEAVVPVSAKDGSGIEQLLELVDRRLAASRSVIELRLDYGSGELLAWLHRAGEVLEQTDDGEGLRLKVAISAPERARLAHRLGHPV